MQYTRTLLLGVAAALVAGCSATNINGTQQSEQRLIDYNTPNVYVYNVKTTTIMTQVPLHTDTLGMVCTGEATSWDPNQKLMSWVYLRPGKDSITRLKEGRANDIYTGFRSSSDSLFIHPVRNGRYTILEICPFPILKFPLFIGRKWGWDLEVGSYYSPSDTIKWHGDLMFHTTYEVKDTLPVACDGRLLRCCHIYATNTSELGTSTADVYYNLNYGIVKIRYLPLDKTCIEFELQLSSVHNPGLLKDIFPNYQSLPSADILMKPPVRE